MVAAAVWLGWHLMGPINSMDDWTRAYSEYQAQLSGRRPGHVAPSGSAPIASPAPAPMPAPNYGMYAGPRPSLPNAGYDAYGHDSPLPSSNSVMPRPVSGLTNGFNPGGAPDIASEIQRFLRDTAFHGISLEGLLRQLAGTGSGAFLPPGSGSGGNGSGGGSGGGGGSSSGGGGPSAGDLGGPV
jgi:hypothetical protein